MLNLSCAMRDIVNIVTLFSNASSNATLPLYNALETSKDHHYSLCCFLTSI